jgi:hypothetical protein
MMQMPGQMRPDMPNIQQIKPSGMGQAAAISSEVDQLKGRPREELLQALMSPATNPPKWAIVTALDRQGKEADIKERDEGADAQRQVAGLGTVVQDVATRRLARGGVVGFTGGGLLKDPLFDTFFNYLRSLKEASETARETSTYGGGRGTQRRSSATVTTPTSPTAADYDPAADVKREERRLLDRRPAPSSTAPASTATANQPEALGTGKPQRTPPPAATTPPQTDGFDIKALQDAMRAAGTVSPAVQAARDALRTQREASLSARERRRAGVEAEMSEKPSMGLAALRIAQAAGKAKNLPEFFSLGSGAVADLQDAETKRLRELRRELMPMEDAEDRLREALAEKQLADRSGDDAARKQADVEVLKAQRDYLDKQRTFGIQEQEAQARTIAAERSGSSGAAGLSAQVTGLNNLIKDADATMNNMMLKQEVRDAAARDKARHIRSLEALLSGNSSLSGMSTADLLKMLGATGGATQ